MKIYYNEKYNMIGILVNKMLIQLDDTNTFMVLSKEWEEIGTL